MYESCTYIDNMCLVHNRVTYNYTLNHLWEYKSRSAWILSITLNVHKQYRRTTWCTWHRAKGLNTSINEIPANFLKSIQKGKGRGGGDGVGRNGKMAQQGIQNSVIWVMWGEATPHCPCPRAILANCGFKCIIYSKLVGLLPMILVKSSNGSTST